jgi:hypothetical protein
MLLTHSFYSLDEHFNAFSSTLLYHFAYLQTVLYVSN